jgi:flagellar biosynthesis protein FlhB
VARHGQPTEPPTPKRLQSARRRGQVVFSRDLTSALAVAAALAALWLSGAATVARLLAYQRSALRAATSGFDASEALGAALAALGRALAWPLIAAVAVALGAGLLQTRGLFVLGGGRLDGGRVSLGAGWRRLMEGGAASGVVSGLARVAAVGAVAWLTLRPWLADLAGLAGVATPRWSAAWGALAVRLAGRLAVAGVLLGAVDVVVAARRHRWALRMTRTEVERERRETEGDPAARAERGRLRRHLDEQQMMADVREASVVVVVAAEAVAQAVAEGVAEGVIDGDDSGPVAVALRYGRRRGEIPVVTARGARLLAAHIRHVARQAGVPVIGGGRLARSLRDVAIGQPIPPALYEPVAEILRVVYGGTGPERA